MTVASGTSTPTSRTVVPTSTSRSPLRKASIVGVAGRGRQLAVDEADAHGAGAASTPAAAAALGELGPQLLRHALDRPAVWPSASSTSGTTTKARCPARTSETTRGHVPRPGSSPKWARSAVAPDARLDGPAAGRRRAQVGDVEVGVEDLAQGARDGGRGHQQHVRRAALPGQRLALGDAEAVLLVDHRQGQVGEGRARRQQGMRAHRDAPVGQAVGARPDRRRGEDAEGRLALGGRQAAGEQLDVVARAARGGRGA